MDVKKKGRKTLGLTKFAVLQQICFFSNNFFKFVNLQEKNISAQKSWFYDKCCDFCEMRFYNKNLFMKKDGEKILWNSPVCQHVGKKLIISNKTIITLS